MQQIAAGPNRRASDLEPARGRGIVLAIAAAVALLDWGTKWWVIQTTPLHTFIPLVRGRVYLLHVQNQAMVLGLWGDLSLGTRRLIAAAGGLAALMFLWEILTRAPRLTPRQRPWAWLFIGLCMGGLAGNLGERAVHWYVTDFLSFRSGRILTPPLNVADLALYGCALLAFPLMAFEVAGRRRRGAGAPSDGQ